MTALADKQPSQKFGLFCRWAVTVSTSAK